MTTQIDVLLVAAASIGFFHTLLGPDHYLPFIVLSKSRRWSLSKTVLVTLGCGLGHILGSVILGLIGIAFGLAVAKLAVFESIRGSLAAWLLIAFGLTYFVWGVRSAIRNKPHTHWHMHEDGTTHEHTHTHYGGHAHYHEMKSSLTPWALFIIFVLGPCEPLIPFLMYPAAQNSYLNLILVIVVFGVVTLFTMLGVVLMSYFGLSLVSFRRMERYTHATAGLTILLCGLSIKFLGL